MQFVYLVLKYIHIFSAIVAIGTNVTYGVWNVLASRDPAHMGFALRGIKFLDDRVANPAYGVLLVTGLIMVFAGHWSITSLWIVLALVLFIAVGVIGVAVYSPLLRNQIRLADAGEAASAEAGALSRRSRLAGPLLGVLVLVILALMVFKPTL